jgi:hypothetical protein
LAATIYHLGETRGADFVNFFKRDLQPHLTETGVSVLASFVTENHPNTFPALPLREDENVFIWFSRFPDRGAYEQCAAVVAESMRQKETAPKLSALTKEQPEVLLLAPTARSLL